MCRIHEKIYVRTDGHRSRFQDIVDCEKARRRGKTCSNPEVRTTEYLDPTSSPMPNSPLTPNGQYQTQTRRPSISSRPSTRNGMKTLKPEIIIQIGSKKGKGKDYPTVSISTKDRLSMGSVVDSPPSDASQTVRTGYPETHVPLHSTYGRGGGLQPGSDQYRNPSSDESLTGSSRAHFQYRTSDEYDTPSLATSTTATTATSSGTRPVIHHGPRNVPSSIDTTRGQTGSPSSPYRTTVITPQGVSNETAKRASHRNASSYAPEITGRVGDRHRRRDEQRRRQEALDREVAANLVREENKRVHFETSRAQDRAEQRADKTFAGRADGRERLRQQERQERDARAAKEAAAREAAARESAAREVAARRPKPSTKPSKSLAPSRRHSVRMTPAEAAKQKQLIDADALQMREERAKAEAIEREEQMQQLPQLIPQRHQQDPRYHGPRGGQATVPSGPGAMPRRPSLSNSQRPNLSRSGSTHDIGLPQARPDRRQPPVSFPTNFNAQANLPQPRERRPSSSHGHGLANPFGQPVSTGDPYDVRTVREVLPSARGPRVGHNLPQQASHRMNQAFSGVEYETDSEDEYYGGGR